MGEDLRELYARGVAGWPGIVVGFDEFARELSRREAEPIAALHHDVYVAIAAARGDEAAARACEEIAAREVEFAARKLRATPTQADEVRSELRRLLFASDEGRPAGLSTFTGRGDLRGYTRVIAARTLSRRMQRDRREVDLDTGVLDAMDDLDPEVAVLRETYRADVDAAFRDALAALSDRARAVLRFHLIDGWSIDQIGERYGTHRSTAARWVHAAHAELGDKLRSNLATRLSIGESQVASIVALVTSGIDVSLERLLG